MSIPQFQRHRKNTPPREAHADDDLLSADHADQTHGVPDDDPEQPSEPRHIVRLNRMAAMRELCERLIRHVPPELAEMPRWGTWVRLEKDGKPTKVPCTIGGRPMDHHGFTATLPQVVDAILGRGQVSVDGISYSARPSDRIVLIDFDHVATRPYDIESVRPSVRDVLRNHFSGTYAEWSQSGHGLHVLCRGLKSDWRCRSDIDERSRVEIYCNQPVVMTGLLIDGHPSQLADCQDGIDACYDLWFPEAAPRETSVGTVDDAAWRGWDRPLTDDDQEVIRHIVSTYHPTVVDLWEGKGTGDRSTDDFHLACAIIRAAGDRDLGRIERIMRASGLRRPKWDERRTVDGVETTWLRMTIVNAARQMRADAAAEEQRRREHETTEALDAGVVEDDRDVAEADDAGVTTAPDADIACDGDRRTEGEHAVESAGGESGGGDGGDDDGHGDGGGGTGDGDGDRSDGDRRKPRPANAGCVRPWRSGQAPQRRVDMSLTIADRVERVEKALIAARAPIYVHMGGLVRPHRDADGVALTPIDVHHMRDLVSRVVQYEQTVAGARRGTRRSLPHDPPRSDIEALLSRRAEWRFPVIDGCWATPLLRPDGRIHTEDGYDPETRLYLAGLPPMDPIDDVTEDDARRALDDLLDLLGEFRFAEDEGDAEVSRAVALSAVMTAVLRPAMRVAPLHAIVGADFGCGKTYAATLCAAVAGDRDPAVVAATADSSELDKRVVALLLRSAPAIILDNLNWALDCAVLAQAVERPVITVRRLGKSESVTTRATCTWYVTGVSPTFGADLCRRTVVCRLAARDGQTRKYRRDPLREITGDPAVRGRYVRDVLIIAAAYLRHGTPGLSELEPLLSYDDWTRLVRGPLTWLGMADPVESTRRLEQDDPYVQTVGELLQAWRKCFPRGEAITVSEILDTLERWRFEAPSYRRMERAILDLFDGKKSSIKDISPRALSKKLAKIKGRAVWGYRLVMERPEHYHDNIARWRVELVETDGDLDDGDDPGTGDDDDELDDGDEHVTERDEAGDGKKSKSKPTDGTSEADVRSSNASARSSEADEPAKPPSEAAAEAIETVEAGHGAGAGNNEQDRVAVSSGEADARSSGPHDGSDAEDESHDEDGEEVRVEIDADDEWKYFVDDDEDDDDGDGKTEDELYDYGEDEEYDEYYYDPDE